MLNWKFKLVTAETCVSRLRPDLTFKAPGCSILGQSQHYPEHCIVYRYVYSHALNLVTAGGGVIVVETGIIISGKCSITGVSTADPVEFDFDVSTP